MSRFRRLFSRTAARALDVVPPRYLIGFAEVINKRHAAAQPDADVLIEMMLRHAADPAEVLNELADKVSLDDVLFGINRLIDGRHGRMNDLFAAAPQVANPVLRSALELWRAETNGSVLSDGELRGFFETSRRFAGRGQRRLELLLLHAMLRAERVNLAEALIDASPHLSAGDLPAPYVIGFLRCVLKNEPAKYSDVRRKIGGGASALDRLRILDLDAAAGLLREVPDHRQVVDRFLDAVPAPVGQEFRETAKRFYDAHDMRFMNARVSRQEAGAVRARIEAALAQSEPLSLIRLGDGEAYAFGDGHGEASDNARRERHWWGRELEAPLRAALQADMRSAIERADILGVPSVHRFIRDVSPLTRNLSTVASTRGLVTVLAAVRPKPGAMLVEDRIHQVLFGREALEALAAKSARVVVVSSLRPEAMAHALPGALSITVPTHDKMRTNDSFVREARPLPFVFRDIAERLRGEVQRGDLVLVGAGIIGKIFVDEARAAGAIALDVGSMLDYLAGAKTRSVADLV